MAGKQRLHEQALIESELACLPARLASGQAAGRRHSECAVKMKKKYRMFTLRALIHPNKTLLIALATLPPIAPQ